MKHSRGGGDRDSIKLVTAGSNPAAGLLGWLAVSTSPSATHFVPYTDPNTSTFLRLSSGQVANSLSQGHRHKEELGPLLMGQVCPLTLVTALSLVPAAMGKTGSSAGDSAGSVEEKPQSLWLS
jgi:hypothetical protein